MANETQEKSENPFKDFVNEEYLDNELVVSKAAKEPAKKTPDDGGEPPVEGEEPPADGAEPPAESEEPPADGEEPPAEGEESPTDGEEPPTKKRQTLAERRSAIQGEINKLIRARSNARQLAQEAYDTELAALRGDKGLTSEKQPVKDDAIKAPDPKDSKYAYGELDAAYIADVAKYAAKSAVAAERAEWDKERQRDAAAQEAQEFATAAKAMAAQGAEKYPDFDDHVKVGGDNKWDCSAEMAQLLVGSEVGADIAYHLAKNPKVAREIAGKPPLEQAAAFGRLEARFSAQAAPAKERTAPQVPPPPKSVVRGAGGKFGPTAATENFAEFEAMAKAQQP